MTKPIDSAPATTKEIFAKRAKALRKAGRNEQALIVESYAKQELKPESFGPCPRCGELSYRTDREVMNARSRRDNKTYICTPCGTDEALMDFVRASSEFSCANVPLNDEIDSWKNPPSSITALKKGPESRQVQQSNHNPLWDDDLLQFSRLLCEIVATQDNLNLGDVATEMDLDVSDVAELIERAHRAWEHFKAAEHEIHNTPRR